MTIELKHQPKLDADALFRFLKSQLEGRYEVQLAPRRQTRRQEFLHGIQWVVIVKASGLRGAFLLVEQLPGRTRVRSWTDAPSEAVFWTFARLPLLVPLLIFVLPFVKIGSAPIVHDVRDCLRDLA